MCSSLGVPKNGKCEKCALTWYLVEVRYSNTSLSENVPDGPEIHLAIHQVVHAFKVLYFARFISIPLDRLSYHVTEIQS